MTLNLSNFYKVIFILFTIIYSESLVSQNNPGYECTYTTTSGGFMPVSCPSSSCNGSTCSYQPMLGYVCFPTYTTTHTTTVDCNGDCFPQYSIYHGNGECDNRLACYATGWDGNDCIPGCTDPDFLEYYQGPPTYDPHGYNYDDGSCSTPKNPGCTHTDPKQSMEVLHIILILDMIQITVIMVRIV